jgi:hypothetical protein
MKIGGGMASKFLFEERWNNIESKGNRKSGILMSIDCTNLTVARLQKNHIPPDRIGRKR